MLVSIPWNDPTITKTLNKKILMAILQVRLYMKDRNKLEHICIHLTKLVYKLKDGLPNSTLLQKDIWLVCYKNKKWVTKNVAGEQIFFD